MSTYYQRQRQVPCPTSPTQQHHLTRCMRLRSGSGLHTTRLLPPLKPRDLHFLPTKAIRRNRAHLISASRIAVYFPLLTCGSAFGNSLSYVTQDGGAVASDTTPFDGTLETSEIEIAVFSDRQCDGDCEYARPASTAHCRNLRSARYFFCQLTSV